MSNTAIRVEDLGKRYKIGSGHGYQTLRDQLSDGVRSLFRKNKATPRAAGADHIWALKNVGFEIERGQVVGVVGRNGAGKSTLLKILSRITEPTKGFAELYGRVGSLLEVGTGFHPELTGRENVFLNGAILGMKRAEIARKFDDIVAFSECETFIDTPVKHYSSGMQLRLAFAVAAHLETEILLIDELLAVGDVAFQKRCLGKMDEVANSGRTILLVSHNMPVISALAERSLLLKDGRVAMFDATETVIREYMSGGKEVTTSLADRVERSGSGELRFTALEICDASGEQVPYIMSGQSAIVRLHYRCDRPVRAWNLMLDMVFSDSLGFPICTFSTRFAPFEEESTLPAEGALECVIPQLLLAEESYSATIWCVLNSTLVDYIQNIPLPPVHNSDFFGTGAMPVKRKHGCLLLPHEWRAAENLVLTAESTECR